MAWRSKPKWVVSRSLNSVGPNATLITDDFQTVIRRLKAELAGEIQVGGTVLAQSLTEAGLIDEYQLYLRPVVLGGGTPFFAGPRPPLHLVASDLIADDIIRLTYVPAYKIRKEFTRKPQPDEPATRPKNYITPSGLQRLKDEHRFLLTRERPAVTEVVAWAASNGDRSENADYQYGKRRLRQIDGRIRFLDKRIEAAEVVDPETPRAGEAATRAFFGATVRYANGAGAERVVSIVGTDEVDLNRNHISWVSPLGRALMKSAAGDSVVLQAPRGTEYLTVLNVCYERISVEPLHEPPGSEAPVRTPDFCSAAARRAERYSKAIRVWLWTYSIPAGLLFTRAG